MLQIYRSGTGRSWSHSTHPISQIEAGYTVVIDRHTTTAALTATTALIAAGGQNLATAGKLARTHGTSAYVAYPFPDGPYRGFDQSRDVFGDGSVVLVPAGGHTPGSIIAFVSLPDVKHYALIGDLYDIVPKLIEEIKSRGENTKDEEEAV